MRPRGMVLGGPCTRRDEPQITLQRVQPVVVVPARAGMSRIFCSASRRLVSGPCTRRDEPARERERDARQAWSLHAQG